MNPFWKTITGAVLGMASLVAAHYSADWIANNTYRARHTEAAPVQTMRYAERRALHVVQPRHFAPRSALQYPHLNRH